MQKKLYSIEFRHTDIAPDARDLMTEWSDVEATSENEAFESNARTFHAAYPSRGIVSQVVLAIGAAS